MTTTEIVSTIDEEISRLTEIRNLLSNVGPSSRTSAPDISKSTASGSKRGPGRPKGSSNKATSLNPKEFAPKRRTMSEEGKARIAAAQRARWTKQKEASRPAANKRSAAKKGSGANSTGNAKRAVKRASVPAARSQSPTVKSKKQTTPAKKAAFRKAVRKIANPATASSAAPVATTTASE